MCVQGCSVDEVCTRAHALSVEKLVFVWSSPLYRINVVLAQAVWLCAGEWLQENYTTMDETFQDWKTRERKVKKFV